MGKYVNSCLWQIVEESEQNLYPVSQIKMVDRLIENTGKRGKLVMTTHSPYVLSILNNYFLALYRFLWDEAETQGMGGMKKGNEVSNL